MDKNKEIAKSGTGPLSPAEDWQVMKEQAQVMIKSGFLPPSIRTPEQCMAIFMTGKELGIGFMESIRSINVIQGKPTISPQLMLALANRNGQLEDIKIDANDQRAIITIKRKGRSPNVSEFGVKEATGLGLMTKDNYKKQPKTMFTWRSLAANLRVTFPDVLVGFYTPEELGADVRVGENESMEVVDLPKDESTAPEAPTELDKLIMPGNVEMKENKDKKPCWIIEDISGAKYYTWDPSLGQALSELATNKQKANARIRISKQGMEIISVSPIEGTLISASEQRALLNLAQEKGVSWEDLRSHIHREYGAVSLSDVRSSDYAKIYEWIIQEEKPRQVLK